MIRRAPTRTELCIDSLTDTMTNMIGMILLMVVGVVLLSGGIKLRLVSGSTDPGQRRPLYLVCRDGRVLFMHRAGEWKQELQRLCEDWERRTKRRPTTTEALQEANRRQLCRTGDLQAIFVREVVRERGQEIYVIGVRFLPLDEAVTAAPSQVFTPQAERIIERADPETEYIDAFVCDSGFDALVALQEKARQRKLALGWRPILEHQHPGLSDHGLPGTVEGER